MVSSPGQSQLDLVAVCGDACDNIAGFSKCFSGVQASWSRCGLSRAVSGRLLFAPATAGTRPSGGNKNDRTMADTLGRRRPHARRCCRSGADQAEMGACLRDLRAVPHAIGLGGAGDRQAHQRPLPDRRLPGLAARQGNRHQPGPVARHGRHHHLRARASRPAASADRRDLLPLHLPRTRTTSSPTPRATSSRSWRRATRTRPATRSWPSPITARATRPRTSRSRPAPT